MRNKKLFLLSGIWLLVAVFAVARAAAPTVRAVITPDSIGIGQQAVLQVEVTKDIMQMVDFPVFNDKLGERIEILAEHPADTAKTGTRTERYTKKYVITCFDAGEYLLGEYPMLYADKNVLDTIFSTDPLVLKVGTYAIDTATQEIFDIRPPVSVPLKVGEFGYWLFYGLLAASLLFLLIRWIVLRRRQSKPIFGRVRPAEPAHVAAIRKLQALHHQKLWQNNRHKSYYTGLTDILREYLAGRYGMRAQEMTSAEIIAAMQAMSPVPKYEEEIGALLRTADLVKFARYVPAADDNEAAYLHAFYFVEETKPVDEEGKPLEPQAGPDEETAPSGTETESDSNHAKRNDL